MRRRRGPLPTTIRWTAIRRRSTPPAPASPASDRQPFAPPSDPRVDCFYVYPTVDLLPNPLLQAGNLPPTPQDDEMAVTLAQAARFSGVCRLFVPVYRQTSLVEVAAGVITGTSASVSLG